MCKIGMGVPSLPQESLGKLKKAEDKPVNNSGIVSEATAKKLGEQNNQLKEELGKDGKVPENFKDLTKIGPKLDKLSFFDDDLKDAKAIIGDMMAESGNPTINHFKLDSLIDGMSKKELTQLAKHLNSLMSKTDGQDEMLGNILDRVLNELSEQDNPKPQKDDNIFIAKYNCSYATRTQII